MTQIQGVEPAVNALIARLASDLNTNIDTINATVTDGYTISHPEVTLDYIPTIAELLAFPTVGVGHGPGRWEDDTGYEATGVYDLAVLAFLQDSDQQALTRKARRYLLALMRSVMRNRNLGTGSGVPWGLSNPRWDFGPSLGQRSALGEPPNTYMTYCGLLVTCKLDEA